MPHGRTLCTSHLAHSLSTQLLALITSGACLPAPVAIVTNQLCRGLALLRPVYRFLFCCNAEPLYDGLHHAFAVHIMP